MMSARSFLISRQLSPSPPPAPRKDDGRARRRNPAPPVGLPNLSPPAPTGPVQIPRQRRPKHPPPRRRPPDAQTVPASVAALLAVTDIPRRTPRQMTVNSIIERTHEAEREISLTLSKSPSPLDVLLSAPEDIDDATTVDDVSTRSMSLDSIPSLADSVATGPTSSIDTPRSPSRARKARPTRRSLTPLSSPPGEHEDHPLSASDIDLDRLDLRISRALDMPKRSEARTTTQPLRLVFKSNLTASLRALRNAARSFNLSLGPLSADNDLLAGSVLTFEPRIPYTDERRPPPLEEEPSAALRRYLNPTTNVRIDTAAAPVVDLASSRAVFTASIQMQTYKIRREPPPRPPAPRTPPPALRLHTPQGPPLLPGPRQRELRENSDFIRIAVMEMAMRRRGKLDDSKPGRARLALPPRKTSSKPYEVGPDGVPARWIAATS